MMEFRGDLKSVRKRLAFASAVHAVCGEKAPSYSLLTALDKIGLRVTIKPGCAEKVDRVACGLHTPEES